ncbi:L-type lectin-domain containing receptor kinase IV.1-like [Iris pallida]|uniref:L-type lectin-domain containing receptor kinase IV.1-like n=1 Tax=Iris pallida TaxID=29817 RepID=A0AAX6FF11_IRIPA|nr:L-type lectin-domain containing receptor kinase IV.1-like [Iris pallida]
MSRSRVNKQIVPASDRLEKKHSLFHHVRHLGIPVQELHHLPHARPSRRHRMRAEQPELEHQLHLLHVEALPQPPVPGLRDRLFLQQIQHPVHKNQLDARRLQLDRSPPARNLQQEGPEGVDVGARGRDPGPRKLRCEIPQCADHMRSLRIGSPIVKPREAEVPQPTVEFCIQQYIARLDIPVEDYLLPLFVQVQEPRRDAPDHPEPLAPAKKHLRPVEQVPVQAPVRHVVVDQEELAPPPAVAEQLDQVAVPDPADGRYLRHELLHALPRSVRHPLHRDLEFRFGHDPPVDAAEASGSEHAFLPESVGRFVQILVRDPMRPVLDLPIFALLGIPHLPPHRKDEAEHDEDQQEHRRGDQQSHKEDMTMFRRSICWNWRKSWEPRDVDLLRFPVQAEAPPQNVMQCGHRAGGRGESDVHSVGHERRQVERRRQQRDLGLSRAERRQGYV